MKDATASAAEIVCKWERRCVATTELDGNLSDRARNYLITLIAELLAAQPPIVQSAETLAQEPRGAKLINPDEFRKSLEAMPEPKRRGRPKRERSISPE